MFTVLAILGMIFVGFLIVGLIVFLLSTCWWLAIALAIVFGFAFLDWCVVKHGFNKLFGKKEKEQFRRAVQLLFFFYIFTREKIIAFNRQTKEEINYVQN